MKRSLTKPNENYFLTLAVFSIVLLAIMRAVGLFGTQALKSMLPAGFVIMMVLPFMLLFKEDRRKIGLQKSTSHGSYLVAVFAGAGLAFLFYSGGILLFGLSDDNWYVTILNSYRSNPSFAATSSVTVQFFIFTIPAMIFSPIGEEIFFRGFLQEVLTIKLGQAKATWLECGVFGITHLLHHGIYRSDSGYGIHLFSGLLWVAGMTGVAWIFAFLRQRSQSIYVAIVAHASFNFFMNYFIFYYLEVA